MNTQPNNPSDFNSLSELYMKACEARFQLLQERSEITAETDAVIRRGKEIVAKLESGAIKPEDPQVKEVLQQLIERRRIGTEFNAELSRLADEQHNNTHTQC